MTDTSFPKAGTWHFHKWSEWRQQSVDYFDHGPIWAPLKDPIRVTKRIQRRHCTVCNKEQSAMLEI